MFRNSLTWALVAALTLSACSKAPQEPAISGPESAAPEAPAIDREQQVANFDSALHQHVKELASDAYEGRAPATPGEEKTIAYIKNTFESLGIEPGNNGSYFQDVPVAQLTTLPTVTLNIKGDNYARALKYRTEMMVGTMQQVAKTGITDSELVFVGYGVVAPEYNWNDYEGIDVTGKTVVVLVNDPGYATQDDNYFTGNAMTYYGRWSYKYEEAARQGAAGVIIIHETGAAGYPWAVVSGSWSGPQITLKAENKNEDRCEVESWIQLEVARDIFNAAGLDLDEQMAAAAKPGFQAVPLNLTATTELQNHINYSDSKNVVGIIPGTERPEEVIIFTAHWDHLGKNPVLDGDQIYNGAMDNATGTGGLLALAKAFSEIKEKPERTLMFLAVTAEESGLLGSKYYAKFPIYPLAQTVAVINMDAMAIYGPMKDVVVIGYGSSELEEYLAEAAKTQGRYLAPEPTPEKGFFYRSDHFSMAKQGVPAIYAKAGVEHIENGREWTMKRNEQYIAQRYHKPGDEYDASWDLRGAAEDLQLYFDIAWKLANEDRFPNWYEGNEFRAIRDKSRAGI